MKWPFVSRPRYELLLHNAEEIRKALHEERAMRFRDGSTIERQHEGMREQTARYDALLEKYHALAYELAAAAHPGGRAHERTGSEEPTPPSPQSAIPPSTSSKPRSVVSETIRDESQGDPRLAAFLRKRASLLRREGKAPEEIAAALGSWQSTEDEGRN